MTRLPSLSRRDWLKLSAAGVVPFSVSGWLGALAEDAAAHPKRRKSCILLWMNGGPSQMDTWDMKPGHVNGGPLKEIQTAVPGIKISELLPKVAGHMEHMAVIRSMSTKEGEHSRGMHYMRTGYQAQGPVHYPSLGSLVAKELGDDGAALPNYVSIAPYRVESPAAYAPGFLGPRYAPLVVGESKFLGVFSGKPADQALKVPNLDLPPDVTPEQRDVRLAMLRGVQRDFIDRHPGLAPASNESAYAGAARLMTSEAARAFNLDEEPAALRDRYGRNQFGQGCMLARRLIERGLPFVEVTHGGVNGEFGAPIAWDTHLQNFDILKGLCGALDAGWATLMADLKQPRPARRHAHRLDGRVRPHAAYQRRQRPRPLPQGVEHGAGRRRPQGWPRHRQDQPRRHHRRGAAGQRARPAGHRLPGARHRPAQGERLQRRPAHPHRGQGRRADQGGAGMTRDGKWPAATALLLLAAVGLTAADLAPPKAAPAPAVTGQPQLLLLGEKRPLRIGLDVRVRGRPCQLAWEYFIARLFDYADVNGDKVLTPDEAQRLPQPRVLLGLMRQQFGLFAENPVAPFAEIDANKDGKVSLDELKNYYRKNGFGPLQAQPDPEQGAAQVLTDALFKHLDLDKDGKLSKQELARAEKVLAALDVNDDELITPEELVPGLEFGFGQAPRRPGQKEAAPLLSLVNPDDPPAKQAAPLLARYDKDKNGKLSRAEVGFDEATFNALDANKDGQLDAAELAGWFKRPADLELMFPLSGPRPQSPRPMAWLFGALDEWPRLVM